MNEEQNNAEARDKIPSAWHWLTTRHDIWGTPSNYAVTATSGLVALVWGLTSMPEHWAVFSFVYMLFVAHFGVSTFVSGSHLWLRFTFRDTSNEWLYSTGRFTLDGTVGGIVERSVFTLLTVALLQPRVPNALPFDGNAQALAIAASGWVALKTLVGWRRIMDPSPVVNALSSVGLLGALASVSLSILAGAVAVQLR